MGAACYVGISEGRKEFLADLGRLLFDGNRIMDDQTAADLDIEDGDSIEVLLEREFCELEMCSGAQITVTRWLTV